MECGHNDRKSSFYDKFQLNALFDLFNFCFGSVMESKNDTIHLVLP